MMHERVNGYGIPRLSLGVNNSGCTGLCYHQHQQEIFCHHEILHMIATISGSQFTSERFVRFMGDNNV